MSSGFNIELYSKREKRSIYWTPYTYFGDCHSLKDVYYEWIKERQKKKSNAFNEDFNIEDYWDFLRHSHYEKLTNSIFKYLGSKKDYIAHWVTYYQDIMMDIEDDYTEFSGCMIIDVKSTPIFISELEKGLPQLEPTSKVNLGFKELVECYNSYEDKKDLIVIIKREGFKNQSVNFLIENNLFKLKNILLDDKFHSFVKKFKQSEIDLFELRADCLVEKYIQKHYDYEDELINYLLKNKTMNIINYKKVQKYMRYPEHGFAENLN